MSIWDKRTEFVAGLRAAAPLLVAMVPIGVVFGAVAIGKGLSPLEASLMSLLVFAGKSAMQSGNDVLSLTEVLCKKVKIVNLPDGSLSEAAEAARKISETAKSVQFQLARAVTRRKFDPLATALDPAIEAWDSLMAQLATRID